MLCSKWSELTCLYEIFLFFLSRLCGRKFGPSIRAMSLCSMFLYTYA